MKMRKELNNKGFSLVELLIATIILGIVVAPLLHSFVTAASTTARSRQMGDATLLGENVAELVETTAMTKTALEALFEDPSFDTNPTDPNNNPPASTYSVASNPRVDDPSKSYSVHSLIAEGVPSGSSVFNVKVTLDPSAYQAGAGINNVKLSDYSEMDGIYAQSLDATNPDLLADSAFKVAADSQHQDGGWDPSSVERVRTMTLDIMKVYPPEDDEDDEEEQISDEITAIMSISYTYTYTYNPIDPTTGEIGEDTPGSIPIGPYRYGLMKQGPFSPTNKGRLPNIYVMYYPFYESPIKTNEVIRINNMINRETDELDADGLPKLEHDDYGKAQPLKIFLVKEETKTSSGAKDPNLLTKENSYMASLEQYVPAGTSDTNYAVVYSNIRENLDNGTSLSGNHVTYDIFRGNYFSVTGRFGGNDPIVGGDLVSRTERDRLFDVTVEIYDVKDTAFASPIHTTYATKLQ